MIVWNGLLASSASMATNYATSAIDLMYKTGYSLQAKYATTGANAPSGFLYLQGSNDPVPSPTPIINLATIPVTWTEVADSRVTLAATTGSTVWNSQMANHRWVRVKWDASSAVTSGGFLTVVGTMKGLSV